MPVELKFPPGRLVRGHPSIKVQKKDNNKQPVFRDGQPVMILTFGVAYEKQMFNANFKPYLEQLAANAYQGRQVPPHFAYKTIDGDTIDKQGRPYAAREGFAGHIVVNFQTELDFPVYRQNPHGGWDVLTKDDYKTGDYIAVSANLDVNIPTNASHTPGIYMNPNGVLLVGVGTQIVTGPSADQLFGGQQYALPPGAQPIGAPPPMPSGNVNPPGMGAPQPQQPQYQSAPQQQPQYAPPVQQQPVYQQPQQPVYQQPVPQQQFQPPAPQQQPMQQPVYQQPAPQQQFQPHPTFVQDAYGQQPQQQFQPPAPAAPMPGQTPGFPPR